MYFDKKKTIYKVCILLTIAVSGVIEVKAKFSYKVLDKVTHSLCTSHSII